jgi:NAD(P)H dehydrogenase (quinone)
MPIAEVSKKSEGMSIFLVDLRQAVGRGLTVRPIANMVNHETNELFFDNLEIPAENHQSAPIAEPEELEDYQAILFGTPTRFGNMASQMRSFLDRTGPLWLRNALVGKIGSVFCSTASQHGGQETTITSFHTTLLHHGMIIVGLPYSFKDLATMREVTGGTPYGASCVTGSGDELRMPMPLELEICRYQGEHVARIAKRFDAGACAENLPPSH